MIKRRLRKPKSKARAISDSRKSGSIIWLNYVLGQIQKANKEKK